MALGQVLGRVRRNIEADAARAVDGIKRVGQIVASSGADLEERGGRRGRQRARIERVLHRAGHRLDEGREMAGGKVRFAGVDHVHVIALVLEASTGR